MTLWQLLRVLIRARTTGCRGDKGNENIKASRLLSWSMLREGCDNHERLKKKGAPRKNCKKVQGRCKKKSSCPPLALIQLLCGYSILMPGKMYRVLTHKYLTYNYIIVLHCPSTPFPPPTVVVLLASPSPRRHSECKLAPLPPHVQQKHFIQKF